MTRAGGHLDDRGRQSRVDLARVPGVDPARVSALDPAWERSARLWLRAYPRRWRAARGEELLGVLADLAAPGARRVGPSTAFDLLRGGWLTRLRLHPPLHRWAAYRLLDVQLPAGFRMWAYDDISGSLFGAREKLVVPAFLVVAMWLGGAVDAPFLAGYLVLAALISAAPADYLRRRSILRHVAPHPGEVLFRGQLVVADGPRRRVAARSGLRSVVAVCGALVLGAAVAATVAPLGWWARAFRARDGIGPGFEQGLGPVVDRSYVPVVALYGLLGAVVLGVLAARRVRRLAPWSVPQPHRELHDVGPRGAAYLAAWTAAGLVLLGLEATGVLVIGISLVVLVGGPAVLVVAVVGLRRLPHGTGHEVALVDVWRAASTGRPTLVDGPVPVVVPITGEVPEGAVVAPRPLGGPPTTLMA